MKFWPTLLLVFSQAAFSAAYIDCPVQSYESACTLFLALKFVVEGPPLDCDAVVRPGDLVPLPAFQWLGATGVNVNTNMFTLIVLDVDYVYPQLRGKGYLMFIKSNILGGTDHTGPPGLAEGTGTVLASWRNSNYQKNMGRVHRIVALVFQHNSIAAQISTPVSDARRPHFNVAAWLFRYRNQIRCIPIDGTQVRVNA